MWVGGLVLLVGAAIAAGVFYPSPADDEEPDSAAVAPRRAQVYREPKTVRLTKADRDVALRNALQFVNTAVARRRIERSYDLVTPELRQGISRTEWGKGEIPVVPFPAAEVRVRVDYSYSNELGLTMMLVPPRASRAAPATFNMDMRAVGSPKNRRWLVSSWTPTANTTQLPVAEEAGSGPGAAGFPNVGSTGQSERGLNAPLGAAWLIVPLSIFGLALMIPVALGVRSWVQNRRAVREYERTRPLDV
jgi:hypothetical protein